MTRVRKRSQARRAKKAPPPAPKVDVLRRNLQRAYLEHIKSELSPKETTGTDKMMMRDARIHVTESYTRAQGHARRVKHRIRYARALTRAAV